MKELELVLAMGKANCDNLNFMKLLINYVCCMVSVRELSFICIYVAQVTLHSKKKKSTILNATICKMIKYTKKNKQNPFMFDSIRFTNAVKRCIVQQKRYGFVHHVNDYGIEQKHRK